MAVNKEKLERLKMLHLSSMTGEQRDAVIATNEGFVLNGILVEKYQGLLDEVTEVKSAPVERETKVDKLPEKGEDLSKVIEPKKKPGRKKKNA